MTLFETAFLTNHSVNPALVHLPRRNFKPSIVLLIWEYSQNSFRVFWPWWTFPVALVLGSIKMTVDTETVSLLFPRNNFSSWKRCYIYFCKRRTATLKFVTSDSVEGSEKRLLVHFQNVGIGSDRFCAFWGLPGGVPLTDTPIYSVWDHSLHSIPLPVVRAGSWSCLRGSTVYFFSVDNYLVLGYDVLVFPKACTCINIRRIFPDRNRIAFMRSMSSSLVQLMLWRPCDFWTGFFKSFRNICAVVARD